MSGHAKLSPSAAKRWMTCPGSVNFIDHLRGKQAVPEVEKTNDAALLGTALHEVAECLLRGDELDEMDLGWTDTKGVERDIPKSMIEDCVMPYVTRMKENRSGDGEIEVRLQVNDHVWGTADHVDLVGTTLYVDDLKTGHGKVEAADNPQLLIYALGALRRYELIDDIDRVVVGIHQDRIGHHAEIEYTVAELEQFAEEVDRATQAALDAEPGTGLVPSNEGCQWCPARAVCPALRDHVQSIVDQDFRDMNLHVLGEAMDRIPAIKAWISGVEDAVKEHLTSGTKVPGYKMVAGRRSRKWTDEKDAEVYLKHRVPKFKATCYRTSLLSPAQMEKALKNIEPRRPVNLDEIITVSGGNPTVVPEDDPRDAMEYGDRAAQDFAGVTDE